MKIALIKTLAMKMNSVNLDCDVDAPCKIFNLIFKLIFFTAIIKQLLIKFEFFHA